MQRTKERSDTLSPTNSDATITTSDGFTVVTSPRRGVRTSALYHHLKLTDFSCLQQHVQKRLVDITEPVFENYILIQLLSLGEIKLLDYLPEHLAKIYADSKPHAHIRIDKVFAAAETYLAKRKLWYQWHFTVRFQTVSNNELSLHVYYHYGECTGIFMKTDAENNQEIKETDPLYIPLQTASMPALNIMLHIINNMNTTKAKLQNELEHVLQEIAHSDIKYLLTQSIEQTLERAYKIDRQLRCYNESVIDRRVEKLETYLYDVQRRALLQRTKNVAVTEEDTESSSLVQQAMSPLDLNQPKTQKKSVPILDQATIREQVTEAIENFCKEYKDYLEKPIYKAGVATNVFAARAQDAIRYYKALQELCIDIESAYINTEDKTMQSFYKSKIDFLHQKADLYDIFRRYVSAYKYTNAIMLFTEIEDQIPQWFYSDFLYAISMSKLDEHQLEVAVKFCKYFHDNSQDYRLLVSLIHYITTPLYASDGTYISLSILVRYPDNGALKLFQTLIAQSSIPDITGYTDNKHAVLLLYVYCILSFDNTMDPFIHALLNLNPRVENDPPNAKLILKNTPECIEYNCSFDEAKSKEQPLHDKDVAYYREYFQGILTVGSALQAYCEAGFRSPDVLLRLVKLSSIEVIAQAFTYRSFFIDMRQGIVYSTQRYGVVLKGELVSLNREIRSVNHTFSNITNILYLGFVFAIDEELVKQQAQADEDFVYKNEMQTMYILANELQTRAMAISEDSERTILAMLVHLSVNRSLYIARQELLRAMAANKAMLLISTYRAPSVDCHAKIAECLLLVVDLYQRPYAINFFTQAVIDSQISSYSEQSLEFIKYSKYASELRSKLTKEALTTLASLEAKQHIRKETKSTQPKINNVI